MELHAVDTLAGMLHGRHCNLAGACGGHETLGRNGDGIEMTHPHVLLDGQVAEQLAGDACTWCDRHDGTSVLALVGARHHTTELLGNEL